jgi:hypothetical protein
MSWHKLVFNTNPGYNYFMDRATFHNTYNPFIENVTATNQGFNVIISDDCGCQKKHDIDVLLEI